MILKCESVLPIIETGQAALVRTDFALDDEVWLEPWRASGFPVIRDLVVDRSAFERIIQAGGYISVGTGSAQDACTLVLPRKVTSTTQILQEPYG